MRRLVLSLLLLSCGVSRAEDRGAYLAQLRTARRLASRKAWHAAAEAYDALLVIAPGDPVALSEEGLVLLHSGDASAAQALFERALARQGDVRGQASILYNLGLACERRDDRTGAISAYERSLRLRADDTVSRALGKLAPDALVAFRAAPHPMDGPTEAPGGPGPLLRARFPAMTDRAFGPGSWTPDDVGKGKCTQLPGHASLEGTSLASLELWQCDGEDPHRGWLRRFEVAAARTGTGWFVQVYDQFWENRWNEGGTLRVVGMERVEVSGRSAIAVRTERVESYGLANPNDSDAEQEAFVPYDEHVRSLVLVGVGGSGRPSVTSTVQTETEVVTGETAEHRARFALSIAYGASGIVLARMPDTATVADRKKWKTERDELSPGTVPVVFP